MGGSLIAVFYLLATFGILATMPVDQISDATGVIESFRAMLGDSGFAQVVILILGLMFLYTLVSNVTTWAMGVNRAVVYAAQEKLLPASLATLHPKTGAPRNVAICNGVIAGRGHAAGQLYPAVPRLSEAASDGYGKRPALSGARRQDYPVVLRHRSIDPADPWRHLLLCAGTKLRY